MSYPASNKQVRVWATANTTIYVDAAAGDDTYGKGTRRAPFATIQAALDHAKTIDGQNFSLTIQCAAGTYAPFIAGPWLNTWGQVHLVGDAAAPTTCAITASGQFTRLAQFVGLDTAVFFDGFHLYGGAAYNGVLITVDQCRSFTIGNPTTFEASIEFGNARWGLYVIGSASVVQLSAGTLSITAAASIRNIILAADGANVVTLTPDTVAFKGTFTSNSSIFFISSFAKLNFFPVAITFNGAISGSLLASYPMSVFATDEASITALVGEGLTNSLTSGVATGPSIVGSTLHLAAVSKDDLVFLGPFYAGAMAYCTDEAGGAVPIFYDGTNWRRVTDRAVVS